jgi:16S rRNA (cytidine1402-2'-O)-methyltransferase
MTNQKNHPPLGTLWIAATTLGNIKDIPLRSLELLKEIPFLVFEEDKRARQFLKAAGVQRQWMRYTEQREAFTLEELEKELRAGHDALYMSDQGTPGLADPGRDLVEVATRIGARVRPIPGPSSLTATISVCPIDCRKFVFAGFPPREESERESFLRTQLNGPWPVILFDTPYRMRQFFETLAKVLQGSDRKIFVGLDISEETEDYWYGHPEQILKKSQEQTEKRNYVVIVEGRASLSRSGPPSNKKNPRPHLRNRPQTQDKNKASHVKKGVRR